MACVLIKKIVTLTLLSIITACYPTDNNMDTKVLTKDKKQILLTDIIRSPQEEVAPFGLTIGKATVDEALSKYPSLIKVESSYITYGKKEVQMPNTYALSLPNNLTAFLQFDESTNILQNILIFGIKNESFDKIKQDLSRQYLPYKEYNLAEFEAFSIA